MINCDNKCFPCVKVLPTVYDNSLSYYEVLCKLATAIDNLNESITDLTKRVTALEEKVNQQ